MEQKNRRGPKKLPDDLKRDHCVSVRLNDAELSSLDEQRGHVQRGEFLRSVWSGNAPVQIPELNRTAWTELSRAASNLNQIAKLLNMRVDVEPAQIAAELAAFRMALIGVQS